MTRLPFAAVALTAATAAFANIPPAYQKYLPPERVQGNVEFISGGRTPQEEAAVKRAAQEWPLEVVFYEKDGRKSKTVENIPVKITNARGDVVFDGLSSGPVLLVKLPKGAYTVTTHWDAWDFSKPVTLGDERERVVFEWKRGAETVG